MPSHFRHTRLQQRLDAKLRARKRLEREIAKLELCVIISRRKFSSWLLQKAEKRRLQRLFRDGLTVTGRERLRKL